MTSLDWFWSWMEGVPTPEPTAVTESPPKQPEFIVLSPVFNITNQLPAEPQTPMLTPIETLTCLLCKASVKPDCMVEHQEWHAAQKPSVEYVPVSVGIYHRNSILTMKDFIEDSNQDKLN